MVRRPYVYLLLATLLVLAACGEEDNRAGTSRSPTTPPEPTAEDSTPTEEATAETTSTIEAEMTPTSDASESDDLGLEGVICCGVHGEVDGESYVFVMALGSEGRAGHGALYVLEVGDEGTLQ